MSSRPCLLFSPGFLKSCTTLLKAEGHGKAGHSPKQSNLWNGAVPIKSQLCKESRSPRDRCRSLETHGGVERTTRHIWLAAEAKQCQHVTQIVYNWKVEWKLFSSHREKEQNYRLSLAWSFTASCWPTNKWLKLWIWPWMVQNVCHMPTQREVGKVQKQFHTAQQ